MKKLFFALICTAIGFSASANDLPSKTGLNTTSKIEVLPTLKTTNSVEKGSLTAEQLGRYRRQMNFVFQDACGKSTRVYVSGASAASDHDLWWFAWRWFVDATIDANNGCL